MFSKTLLIILLVNVLSDYSYGQRDKKFFRKDYTYLEASEGFYKIHTLHKSWADAKRVCALEGASLFYPENDNEAHAVISFWSATQPFWWVYVGISDLVVKGVFESIHGHPIVDVYHNWGAGEPNDAGGDEDCVILRKDGTLNDDGCLKKNPFICKKSLLSLEWNQQCNIPNLDYVYNEEIGRCYKFHQNPLNWTDAYAVCSGEQSYLAVINTQLEADFLVRLTENKTKIKVSGNFQSGAVHLGFHNRLNDGWQAVRDGQTNQVSFREDYTYIEAGESFYKIHMTKKNWRDAKRECALEGASLFYPENSDEANAVISFWTLYQNNTQPDDTWVFVGISDIITEGVYETIDGKSIFEVYNTWKINQPDNSGDEDCLHLNQEGYINDIRCDAEYSFVCKKSLPSLERNCSCNIQQSNIDEQRDKTFFRKDYTYIESEESFYKVHTITRSFADAKRMCALEGASLFYAENEDEANAVISFWNRTKPNIPWVFVGLSDIMAEGLFETVDQRPITEVYSRWQRNTPDNFGGEEDCVHMDLLGTMNDISCDYKSSFICKKSLQSLEWNYDCNMPNLDYTFNNNTGKCYKLHTTPLNWAEAYAMCRIEYTSLAVISNRMEADYLEKFMKSTPKPRVNDQYQRGIYHLGFHNRFNEGWQTVRGTPMTVDADTWFDNHQADGNHYEECGSMFFNGRLINTDCNTKSMFICEHEVDGSN